MSRRPDDRRVFFNPDGTRSIELPHASEAVATWSGSDEVVVVWPSAERETQSEESEPVILSAVEEKAIRRLVREEALQLLVGHGLIKVGDPKPLPRTGGETQPGGTSHPPGWELQSAFATVAIAKREYDTASRDEAAAETMPQAHAALRRKRNAIEDTFQAVDAIRAAVDQDLRIHYDSVLRNPISHNSIEVKGS